MPETTGTNKTLEIVEADIDRLYDNWFLLMLTGIAIMGVVYSGWVLW
mgnify:CR=1 FL=1